MKLLCYSNAILWTIIFIGYCVGWIIPSGWFIGASFLFVAIDSLINGLEAEEWRMKRKSSEQFRN